jgi:hypothetical protein
VVKRHEGGRTADELAQAMAGTVAELFPLILACIPPGPAAELGRLGVPPAPDSPSLGVLRHFPGRDGFSTVLSGLRSLPSHLPDRLLGALELRVGSLSPEIPAGLAVPGPPEGTHAFGILSRAGQSELLQAVSEFDTIQAGATELAASIAKLLAGEELLGPLLSPALDGQDERSVAAAHGAAYLALTVATATVVLRAQRPPSQDRLPAAIVGTGLSVAGRLLADAPMPPAYAAAKLAKLRAEYLLPRAAYLSAVARDHRFFLVEGERPESADFSRNGLVDVVAGGLAVRTAREDGQVSVTLQVLREPPEAVDPSGWDEVVDVSWTAATGFATTVPGSEQGTPPWPGTYRARVQADGRDGEKERYGLIVWAAPEEPETVHKRFDRLGYRLRGEPEPTRPAAPEAAYHWVKEGWLSNAATITVVAGCAPDEVVRRFGGDPGTTASITDLVDDFSLPAWIAVVPVAGAVVCVENNGWRGTDQAVLRSLSAGTRAASMFWNVNALTRLSFARDGEVLASFEVGLQDPPDTSEVTAVLAGLDFDDHRDKVAKALVAVERFTGHAVLPEHVERVRADDVAYPVSG